MAFIGMDPTVVRDVGQRLKAQAGEVGSVIASVDKLINRALGEWDGHDAHQFHGWWTSQHRPVLRDVQQKLDGLGQSALNNATEQEHGSSVHGGSAAGAGGATTGAGGAAGSSSGDTAGSSGGSASSSSGSGATAGGDGPPAPYNAAILKNALATPPGSNGGECAIFAENVIRQASGVQVHLGLDFSQYQDHWAQFANPVQPNDLQAGDIVQFYNPGGKYPVHTSVITGGDSPANATVIDSNYVGHHIVGTGTLADRAPTYDGHYKIWRIEK